MAIERTQTSIRQVSQRRKIDFYVSPNSQLSFGAGIWPLIGPMRQDSYRPGERAPYQVNVPN